MTGILLSQIHFDQHGKFRIMGWWFHGADLNLANLQGAQCQIQCRQCTAVPDSYS